MPVRPKCLLARFAVESGRLTNDLAKPKLFEPTLAGELSTFDVEGLTGTEVCKLGIGIAKEREKRLHGWGEISCQQIGEAGLEIDRDNDPPRHVTIRGWPQSREERKQRQLKLASLANALKLDAPTSDCLDCETCE